MKKRILIRGGGDLASGVAACLYRHGWQVVISELPEPLVVRRKVAFAEAVWDGSCQVEEISAVLVADLDELAIALEEDKIAVKIDPDGKLLDELRFDAVVDARMLKDFQQNPWFGTIPVVGLGPGFEVGSNCDAVIETKRGKSLGKAIWEGRAEANTGIPGIVDGRGLERVLYAPAEGVLKTFVEIGDIVQTDTVLAEIGGVQIRAHFEGLVRGMARPGLRLKKGIKIGDIDPRLDVELSYRISDKALLIGEGVLTALNSLVQK